MATQGRKGGKMPAEQDAERWETLAAEARAAAERMTDPTAQRTLLAIAAAYERLARSARQRNKASNTN